MPGECTIPCLSIHQKLCASKPQLFIFLSTLSPYAKRYPTTIVASPRISMRRPTSVRVNNGTVGCRFVHSSEQRTSSLAEIIPGSRHVEVKRAPLSVLPLGMVLRSLVNNTICSSPILLSVLLRVMATLVRNKNPILNPEKNPILRYILRKSFYSQFCAGENAIEVRDTIARLKSIGFTGVILGYAKEAIPSDEHATDTKACVEKTECAKQEVMSWASGTMATIRLADSGDYVAVKFTGAGSLAYRLLAERLPATAFLEQAIDSICRLAQDRGVRLLFDAEKDMLQEGIDEWTMHLARKYNTLAKCAIIYNTYQSYRKCTPAILSRHLAEAQADSFTLGIKLVRGAYLSSDPRGKFHQTKKETDICYDSIASSVLTRQWGSVIEGSEDYPNVHLVLATHNRDSFRHVRGICDSGRAKSSVAFAQLQGMADELSCELVDANASNKRSCGSMSVPIYKHLAWGTISECMSYLLRRAQENKEAMTRVRGTRDAMLVEVMRRLKEAFYLA